MNMPSSPFPWLPMLAISTGLISHSYALTSLFPYVGYMVQHLGITDDKDEAGFYAGYLSSAFMVGRFGSSYFWGRFADKYGRLPVMYIGLSAIAILSIAFGLTTSFYWAIACRFLLGAMNGLIAISKTMISEVCNKEHEVRGMSFITASWSIGLVIGPGFGGLLAEPTKHYPNVFSESGLFGRFPYLLPNIVGASMALMGLPMVFFFLKETRAGFTPLPTRETPLEHAEGAEDVSIEVIPLENGAPPDRHALARVSNGDLDVEAGRNGLTSEREAVEDKNGYVAGNGGRPPGEDKRLFARAGTRPSSELLESVGQEGSGQRGSVHWRIGEGTGGKTLERVSGEEGRTAHSHGFCRREGLVPIKLLAEPKVRAILFVYGMFSFISIGGQEVYPLWALSTVVNGGLDWTTKQIGQVLAVCGGGMLIFQMVGFPILMTRLGVSRSQRWGVACTIPSYFGLPLLSRLHGTGLPLFAATLGLMFVVNTASSMMFVSIALTTNNAVDPSRRGTLNGLSMTLGSLAKAAGPTAFSVAFAWSINRPRPFPFDYHLVFYLLALGMVVVAFASWDVITHDSAETETGGEAATDDVDGEGDDENVRLLPTPSEGQAPKVGGSDSSEDG